MSDGRHRVALLCVSAWGIRNLVDAGVFSGLVRAGIDASLLCTPAAYGMLEASLRRHAHVLPAAPVTARRTGIGLLNNLVTASFARRHVARSHAILDGWRRRAARPSERARLTLAEHLAAVGAREPFYGWQLAIRDGYVARTEDAGAIDRLLRDLAPMLLVSTSCVEAAEGPALRAAARMGVPRLGWILSFDNLTSRGVTPRFDEYIVWGPTMARWVRSLQPGLPPERVAVTGSPQFDFHVQAREAIDRPATLRMLGLPSGARYLLYAASTVPLAPSEPELVAHIVEAARCDAALGRHHLVVRLHPLDDADRWRGLPQAGVRLSVPWQEDGTGRIDQALLVASLRHADACLSIASTMALDAAMVGTPAIGVGFGATPGSLEDRFCHDVHLTDHYEPLITSGGVRLAGSVSALLETAAAYVADPTLDAVARGRMVAEQCGPMDGRAAERVVAAIRAAAERAAHRP